MFEQVLSMVRQRFEALPDVRKGGNNQTYSMADAALSAFSVFVMQSASFLAHQRDMERMKGRDNLHTLFHVYQTPSDNQIRALLDPVPPETVGGIFWEIYDQMREAGLLDAHRGIHDNLLCGLDGTQYFSSTAICCQHCSQQQREDHIHYSHSVIMPVLVAPDSRQVFSLEPEFIRPQDGAEKQDCEQNAFKRWVERNARRLPDHQVTLLADDLHCHQPACELCLAHKLNFIFVCLPDSHPTLYEEVELLERIDEVAQPPQRPLLRAPCLPLRQPGAPALRGGCPDSQLV